MKSFRSSLFHNKSIVQVKALLDTCIERITARDASAHIPVSGDRLTEINERALLVNLPGDLEIDNCTFIDVGK